MKEEQETNVRPAFDWTPTARQLSHDAGVALVEYALLVMLVAMTSLGAMNYLGGSANQTFEQATVVGFPANGGICGPGDPSYPDC